MKDGAWRENGLYHRVSDDWGWGSCCSVKDKKRGGREVGATARNFELPPTRLIAVCLCLMVVIGGATTREQVAGGKGKAIAFKAV